VGKVEREAPRVVIADDDEDVRTGISLALKLDGYKVWKTKSAKECLETIKDLKGLINVVVINGTIASDRNVMLIINLKRINPSIKVLVIADRREALDKMTIMDFGADEFVLKPLTLDSITNKVTMLLAETVTSKSMNE
jgi:DNA-binding NtrC family response regulator